MTTRTMTLLEIRQAGLIALAESLGPVGMIRFLQQSELGDGDYVATRRTVLGDTSVAEIVERIRGERTVHRNQS